MGLLGQSEGRGREVRGDVQLVDWLFPWGRGWGFFRRPWMRRHSKGLRLLLIGWTGVNGVAVERGKGRVGLEVVGNGPHR